MGRKPDVDEELVAAGKCGRWRNGRQKRCRANVKPKGTPCRNHGRDSKKGPESGTWKHGGASKYRLPAHLQDSYQRFLEDGPPDLVAEIAQLRTMVQRLWEEAEEGDGPKWRKRLARAWAAVRMADTAEDRIAAEDVVDELIRTGAQEADTFSAVSQVVELIRRCVDVETKRRREDGLLPEEVAAWSGRMTHVVLTLYVRGIEEGWPRERYYSEIVSEMAPGAVH